MPNIKVSDLIKRAKTVAQDLDFVQWEESEWLDWYNECILTLVSLRADAFTAIREIAMDKSASAYELPADVDRLVDVFDYSKTGRIVRHIDRNFLDQQYPYWRTQASDDGPKYYVYDDNNPRIFHVYPSPLDLTHTLKVVVSAIPSKTSNTDESISVDERFAPAIVDYMLYRGYLKNSDYEDQLARAKFFMDSFYSKLGVSDDS